MQRAGCRTSASQSMPARLNGNIREYPMIEPLMNAAPLQPVLSRRGFIFGISALAGGLVLGTPAAFAQAGAQAPTPAAAKPGQPELTAWVVIQSDDSVLIRIARSDMGQGIFTSLPMLVAENVSLKRPQDWRLIGSSPRPFDIQAKITGQLLYAIDVRLSGMLHAAINACPAYGGKLKSFDAARVMGMPGVRQVVQVGDTAVAVVASTWWEAKKALDALPVVWDEGISADVSTDVLLKTFQQGLDAADVVVGQRIGDVDAALASAARRVTADYHVPYLAHATMEPQTCTVHVVDRRAEVWAPTQNGEGTAPGVAQTLGVDVSKVIVHKCHLGGGFRPGGLSQDWARQAV